MFYIPSLKICLLNNKFNFVDMGPVHIFYTHNCILTIQPTQFLCQRFNEATGKMDVYMVLNDNVCHYTLEQWVNVLKLVGFQYLSEVIKPTIHVSQN